MQFSRDGRPLGSLHARPSMAVPTILMLSELSETHAVVNLMSGAEISVFFRYPMRKVTCKYLGIWANRNSGFKGRGREVRIIGGANFLAAVGYRDTPLYGLRGELEVITSPLFIKRAYIRWRIRGGLVMRS